MTPCEGNRLAIGWVKICALLLVFCAQLVFAHVSIDHRIQSATARLETNPTNTDLYLLRGALYVSDRQWRAAEADFRRVVQLDPSEFRVHLYFGRLHLAEQRLTQAAAAVKRYLAFAPKDSSAHVTLAEIYTGLGLPATAAEHYDLAIASHPKPSPEWYLLRAQTLSISEPPQLEAALLGLDQGLDYYGSLASLQLYAVSIEVRMKAYDAALARLDTLARQSSRKELWLQRSAEILHQAGRDSQALQMSEAAQAALLTLTASKLETKAMRELQVRILAFQKCVLALGSACDS